MSGWRKLSGVLVHPLGIAPVLSGIKTAQDPVLMSTMVTVYTCPPDPVSPTSLFCGCTQERQLSVSWGLVDHSGHFSAYTRAYRH